MGAWENDNQTVWRGDTVNEDSHGQEPKTQNPKSTGIERPKEERMNPKLKTQNSKREDLLGTQG
jgi:hypothetical protein